MGITAITIENFKGIKDPVRVDLKPITLLFGPNSAGKSTIVQALHYAREIFERQNLNPDHTLLGGDAIDLGGFESLVHGHNVNLPLPIRIKFDLDLTHEDLPRYLDVFGNLGPKEWKNQTILRLLDDVQTAWVKIVVSWSSLLDRPLLTSYQVGINGEELATIKTSDDGRQVFLTDLNPLNPIFLDGASPEKARQSLLTWMTDLELFNNDLDDEDFEGLGRFFLILHNLVKAYDNGGVQIIYKDLNLLAQDSALPKWGSPLQFEEQVIRDITDGEEEEGNFIEVMSSLITGPGELIREELRKLIYVGPLREIPHRGHRPITSPDETRWANGLAAYDILFFAEEAFIDQVNKWLTQEDRLATGYSVDVKKYRELETDSPLMITLLQDRILDEDVKLKESVLALPIKRRLLIRDEARNIEFDAQDIGVGISQVLPVVVVALSPKSGMVAIEQPELHIHPALQTTLGDLFIEKIRECQDITFILETHSEHLILRLLRRIRETSEHKVPAKRELTPSELSVYFIEQVETGISCYPIRVDQDGDFIDRWPRGFFTERAEELF